jgi:hypothetical protein
MHVYAFLLGKGERKGEVVGEPVFLRYQDESGDDVYQFIEDIDAMVESFGVVVGGADLTYEEQLRLQSHVRRVVAQALKEYEPSTEPQGEPNDLATQQQRGRRRRRPRLEVSLSGLPISDTVSVHIERRLQQELLTHMPVALSRRPDVIRLCPGPEGIPVGATEELANIIEGL